MADDTITGTLILGTEGPDTLSGTGGDDTIRGLGGNDDLTNGSGADLIDGGPGDDIFHGLPETAVGESIVDTLVGGEGNDKFILLPLDHPVGSTRYGIAIDGGPGIDTVDISSTREIGVNLSSGQTNVEGAIDGVENVITRGARTGILGNAADNLFASMFTLNASGLEGDDTMFGGSFSEFLDSGPDDLRGDDGDDWLIGNAGDDVLRGGNGNDLLFGTDDDDRLFGGTGSDTLFGERDKDTLDGGEDGDRYIGGEEADVFRLEGGSGLDTIYDFKRGEGDKISIVPEINNSEIVSFAQLTIFADAGGSLIFLGNGRDGANWLAVLGVNDLRASDFVFEPGSSEFPVFIIGTAGSDLLTGTASGDTLDGGFNDAGNDTLLGFAGNDLLTAGGPGADLIDGGSGNDLLLMRPSEPDVPVGRDTFVGGTGGDLFQLFIYPGRPASDQLSIDGGAGADTLRLSQSSAGPVSIDLATGVIGAGDAPSFSGIEIFELDGSWSVTGTGSNDVVKIEALAFAQGLGGDDTIFGGRSLSTGFLPPDDSLDGGEGNDWLIGRLGNDTLVGGNGDDVMWGTEGRDLLLAGAGNDNMFGEDGIDTLNGGGGSDSFSGGANGDVFRFDSGSGLDLVFDFSRAEGDRISIQPNVNGSGITSFANLTLFTDAQGTQIVLGGGHQITVLGVFDLQAGDFIFA